MTRKVGRNDLCPCGSGKKYKFCHGKPGAVTPLESTPSLVWQAGDIVTDDFEDDDDWLDAELPDGNDLLFGLRSALLAEPATPLAKARRKVNEAYTVTGNKRRRLAHEALEIYPDCPDAYIALADDPKLPVDEAAAYFDQALAADARLRSRAAQSDDFVDHYIANDWTNFTEATIGKAGVVWLAGRREEAIAQLAEAQRVVPSNLQGIRLALLNWYLLTEQDHPGRALALLREHTGTACPWVWASALAYFADGGDAILSRWWLAQARWQNPHIPALLTGRRRPPKHLPDPDEAQDGSRAEAAFYAVSFGETWRTIPGAVEWLKQFRDDEPIEVLGPGSRTDGYRWFLNTYQESGYVKCPQCRQPTAKRKFSIAVLVEPSFLPVARLEARACDACNLLIVKEVELDAAVNTVMQHHAPGRAPRYHPLGTIEHAAARQLEDGLLPPGAAREHVRLFQESVAFAPSTYEHQPLFGGEFARLLLGDEFFAEDAPPDQPEDDPNIIDIG